MIRGRITTLVTTIGLLATGCAAGPPSGELAKDIESFQFGDTEWYDSVVDTTVTLKGGLGHRDTDEPQYAGGLDWRMLGPPAYTDIDGDGDEDAAVGLFSGGGQMASQTWFVWLWEGHTAKQVRRPIAESSRCDKFIESVTAKRGTFTVRSSLFEEGDNCASGGSIPIVYDVGLRDGWPVRTAPTYGPLDTCDTRQQTKKVAPARDLQLRVADDDASPPVGDRTRYDTVLVKDYELNRPPDSDGHGAWVLVTAVRADERVCGWARAGDILGT